MFRWVRKALSIWRLVQLNGSEIKSKYLNEQLTTNLAENIKTITKSFSYSNDVIVREFSCNITIEHSLNFALIYIEGLVSEDRIQQTVIKPIIEYNYSSKDPQQDYYSFVESYVLTNSQVARLELLNDSLDTLLAGDSILLVDGYNKCFFIGSKDWPTRGVEDTKTDVTIRGPHQGFTETLRTNTTLIRRTIRNTKLTFENFIIGKQTRTDVVIAYLKGYVHPAILHEVKKRIKEIKADIILESGYIEELISDSPLSMFSTISYTERPDVVASKLLEGRVAIIIDGTPIVLTAPKVFIESFQHPADYYVGPSYYTSILRAIRFISFLISTTLPAIYVAVTSYHMEMLPAPLLKTIQQAMEGTPFPSPISMLIMLFIAEILNQASVGLPRQIGQAVSIVGALVLGEAAVASGLIGDPEVIIVGLSVVSSYAAIKLIESMTILRVVLLILATVLGALGIAVGVLFILTYLSTLTSFGVPYLTPIAPIITTDIDDTFFRDILSKAPSKAKTIKPVESTKQFNKQEN